MPPRKRAAEAEETSTRAKKAAKTDHGETASSKTKGKRGAAAKSAPSFESFKAKALPIHLTLSHSPPKIEQEDASKPRSKGKDKDGGYIGHVALQPSMFGTGSYGWKGTKRIQVELEGEDGKKEKVTVQIQINAPVHGSKDKKEGEKDDDEEDEAADD
ncbi:hypothetical protein BKA62DRAFT_683090, partial [Auriculariales sp. MPI-PUGE-AT-0066]